MMMVHLLYDCYLMLYHIPLYLSSLQCSLHLQTSFAGGLWSCHYWSSITKSCIRVLIIIILVIVPVVIVWSLTRPALISERHLNMTCDWILENQPYFTLGLIHFIGPPTNSYTHTLPIHSVITRLSWLVCFSGASFANPVNSRLRQWDPWRALHGRHGPEIHPSGSETTLRPSKHAWTYGWHFLDS